MEPRVRRPEREDGFALVVVLIVLMIVAIVATDLARRARVQLFLARNASDDLAIEQAALGWVEVVKGRLAYDRKDNQIDSEDDVWAEAEIASATLGDVSLEVEVVDEASKFNLRRILDPDKAVRAKAREQFQRLLVSFRQGTDREVAAGRAEDLLDKLVEYLERKDADEFPVPEVGSNALPMLTVDELKLVEGFHDPEDPEDRILYDEFRESSEEELAEAESVEPIPGLWRFVTLVSDGPININTAPVEVLRSLFRNPSDWDIADAIVAYRTGQAAQYDEDVDPDAESTPFKTINDLTKVDGIDSKVIADNDLDASAVTVSSNVFSIMVFASRGDLTRQFRTVVRRHDRGFVTLLQEERKDPRYRPPEDDEAE